MTVTSLGYSLEPPEFVHFRQCPCSNDQGYLCTVCKVATDNDIRFHCPACGAKLKIRRVDDEWDDCQCDDISESRLSLAMRRLA